VMPGAGGPELASRLLSVRPQLRVVYMSGYTDGTVLRQGIADSHTNFLQKPFTAELLTRKVRAALDERR
jgi:two-component system, cell cycle sensor histidine kinase and response regulator CckA